MNSEQIRNLKIPFAKVLPAGALKQIQEKCQVSEHTPRRVLQGDWTNPAIIKEALNIIKAHKKLIEDFLEQFEK